MDNCRLTQCNCQANACFYLSYELFTRFMSTYDEKLPREHARRAKVSWDKMVERLSLQ